MGLFSDGFKELKKASEPLYKAPKSIQETIEILKVAENGIFEVSKGRYSKCYLFQDLNYTTTNEEEQIEIFEHYCKFLNSLDCVFKITINNKNKDMVLLRDVVLLGYRYDEFDRFRKIYNDIIEEKIREGRQGIEQEKYLTLTIERKNFEEAKAQFATLEATIQKAFAELGTTIRALNGNERLKVLHDFYHLGNEDDFDFDIKHAKKVGADFRNDLCNGMLKYFPDHIEDEGKYVRALFFKKYPSSLSDGFLNKIASLPVHSITSIDVVPIPKDLTTRTLQKKYLGIESDIIKQQRVRNKNNDFSSEISYAKRTEKKEIEEIMDDVRENDQCLFYVAVTVILVAESKEELESVTETLEAIGKGDSVTIDTHYLKQREALALIDILASTGMRVGELVLLNRDDISFDERECVVFGKGDKERMVYFDARTKIHLQNYLDSRKDNNEALFVSLKAPYNRMKIGGIELRLREMGKRLKIEKVHPHKFRRTLATVAIDKGMPIEQLQKLLGHQRIDTTLQYAMVKQSNVKIAHRKYIG